MENKISFVFETDKEFSEEEKKEIFDYLKEMEIEDLSLTEIVSDVEDYFHFSDDMVQLYNNSEYEIDSYAFEYMLEELQDIAYNSITEKLLEVVSDYLKNKPKKIEIE